MLDLDHDLHAVAAIRAYADSCESEFPKLAQDLRDKADFLIAVRRSATDLHRAINKIGAIARLPTEALALSAFATNNVERFLPKP